MQCHLRTLSCLHHWNLCLSGSKCLGLLFLFTSFPNPASALSFTFPGSVFFLFFALGFQSMTLTSCDLPSYSFCLLLGKMQHPRGS